MLRIMLCGAADTEVVRNEFTEVALDFGGEPWHFLAGRILHINSGDANWHRNSALTVERADLCVFAIVEQYGEITWETELRNVLLTGKPFLILCLQRTYQKYYTLRDSITDREAIVDAGERRLVDLISELESERQATITTFEHGTFRAAFRHQLASLFTLLLGEQEKRDRRGAVARLMGDPARLTTRDLVAAQEMALDETEDKAVRKRAVRALAARRAADGDAVQALLASPEQGIQRLTVHLLADLHVPGEFDDEFLDYCVAIANESDDVGIARRLIPTLLDIDVVGAVRALAALDLSEIGSRRRLAEALEAAEETIVREDLLGDALALLDKCLHNPREAGWLSRCREFRRRLAGP